MNEATAEVDTTDASASEPGSTSASPLHWVGVLLRIAVGAHFLYLGYAKITDIEAFSKVLVQYDILPLEPAHIVNFVSIFVPYFEVFLGVLLILGIRTRATLSIVIGMLIFFTAVVTNRASELIELSQASANPETWSTIAFDCGCGGGPQKFWTKAVENGLLLVGSFLALVSSHRRLSIDALWTKKKSDSTGV